MSKLCITPREATYRCVTDLIICVMALMAYPTTTADYAELWVDRYAGEDTAKLEEMYRKIGHRKGIGSSELELHVAGC